MADNEKKGPRDISDLKARLGLKKQAGGAPAPGPASTPAPAPIPGAPAPAPVKPAAPLPAALTGVPAPGSVPPPPGFTLPPEAAPPPPDPRRDPFAAQQAAAAANLAAFYGIGQQIPGDASQVEEEQKKPKSWAMIGGAVGIGVGALVIGYMMGNISVGRSEYNETTEQAAKIRDEVEKIQKQVAEVGQLLKDTRGPNGINFDAFTKLKAADLKEPDMTARLFKTNYFSFEPSTVNQLFDYYAAVKQLAKQVQVHATRTLNDKDAITKAMAGGSKAERGLGVILDLSQKVPSSQLVELASGPTCTTPGKTDCDVKEMKLAFRTSTGGNTQNRPLKGRPDEVVFPMAPTELRNQILAGDTNHLALEAFGRRQREIIETVALIVETEKQLIGNLKKRAEQPKLFTLF